MERCVERDDGRLVPEGAREVESRPHGAGDWNAVNLHDFVVPQAGDVAAEHSTAIGPSRWGAGDVYPVEGDVPQRQAEEHGGRLMADHRWTVQARQRRAHEQSVPIRGRWRQDALEVGASPQPGQVSRADQARELVVGPALAQRFATQSESWLERFGGGHTATVLQAVSRRRRCDVSVDGRWTVDGAPLGAFFVQCESCRTPRGG